MQETQGQEDGDQSGCYTRVTTSSPPVHTTNHVHWRLQMFLSFVHYLPLPTDAIHNMMKYLEGQATFGRAEGGVSPAGHSDIIYAPGHEHVLQLIELKAPVDRQGPDSMLLHAHAAYTRATEPGCMLKIMCTRTRSTGSLSR